jgi:hypothetical protein
MIRVAALVEGPTERNFGQQLLAPHLGYHGISFSPKVIGKSGHKGGNRWEIAKREIIALIRQGFSQCTTMFDLYGLPSDWPGRSETSRNGLKKRDAARAIESAIEAEIAGVVGANPTVIPFFAHLSLHEYEALLFSDPVQLASVTMGAGDAEGYASIVKECGSCEEINDDPQTAPSNRILQIAPRYKKTTDGPVAAQRIGLQTMRNECPHFDQWLTRLEQLGEQNP